MTEKSNFRLRLLTQVLTFNFYKDEKNQFVAFVNYLLIAVAMILFIPSCLKDQIPAKDTFNSSEILVFKDLKEYSEKLAKINSMSTEERKTYEESEGYKSFGRQCMEIYNNINPEEFKSMEEIKSFVAANSEYLQLIEEENGDLTLEIALFRNPNRYLLNKDRMFQVGNRVYKAFEGATVSSEPKNTAILKDLGQNSLIPYEKNHEFQIDYIKNKELFTGLAKNDEENCGVSASEEADIHYIYTGVGTPRR